MKMKIKKKKVVCGCVCMGFVSRDIPGSFIKNIFLSELTN